MLVPQLIKLTQMFSEDLETCLKFINSVCLGGPGYVVKSS